MLALATIVASLAAPVAAQQDQPQGSDIVVQGTRVGKQQIRDFIKALTDVPFYGQLGRFHDPACPVAMGLTAAQNAAVADRMRRVAEAANVGAAPAKCVPNMFVIVTPDKGAAVAELRRRFPMYFSGVAGRKLRELQTSAAPAVAWQVASLRSADGLNLEKDIGGYYVVRGTMNPSRIRSPTEPAFVASVVVIDIKAAAGLTTTELADYAAMRSFADIEPERMAATGAPTILGILTAPDDKPLPLTLTYWDLGYLKALYSTENSYYVSYQRGDMERVMKNELERRRSADKPKR